MSGSGDYISREETLERLCKDVCNVSDCQCDEARCEEWFVIHDVPASDVRPVVKSKWADNHVSFYRGCPECGAFVRANLDEVFLRDFPSAVGKLNFCPNCGADMRGESDV